MSRATYPLKLPNSVKKAAQRLAKEDGVSLNQWIAAAVAEKVGAVETAAAFFQKRAGNAKAAASSSSFAKRPTLPPSLRTCLLNSGSPANLIGLIYQNSPGRQPDD